MTSREQRAVLRRVLQTYTKTVDLEGALRLSGDVESADRVARKSRELRREVDRLRRDMWRRWRGSATRLEEQLRRRNARLQAEIRAIERDVRTGDHLARALGVVDEVLSLVLGVGLG